MKISDEILAQIVNSKLACVKEDMAEDLIQSRKEIEWLKNNMREAFKYLTEIDETRLTIESWYLVQNAREHLELEDE